MNRIIYTRRVTMPNSEYNYEVIGVEMDCEPGTEKITILEARQIVAETTTKHLLKERKNENSNK